jgi:hypothetical protein
MGTLSTDQFRRSWRRWPLRGGKVTEEQARAKPEPQEREEAKGLENYHRRRWWENQRV